MKVFVIFDSKYGNTERAAQQIANGIKEVGAADVDLSHVKNVNLQKLFEYDALVFGAPNHMGRPSRTMTKFIDSLEAVPLKAKHAAVFDTYFSKPRNCGKAMRQMEQRLGEKLPALKLIVPGISLKVEGVNGPLAEGELPKCKEFGKMVADQLIARGAAST